MKLTKYKLKQLIREELQIILERGFGEGEPADPQGFSAKRDVCLEEEEELEEKKKGKAVNPWAVCTDSVGREDKEKYERCVKKVKSKHKIKKD
mgnify:CR=1 FL=1